MGSLYDGLTVVAIALGTTALSETITYFTTYRTTRYQGMKADLEKGAKKLAKMKADISSRSDPKVQKRIEKEEERLKMASKELQATKSKSMMVISLLSIGIMTTLHKSFGGYVVATLPFEPISFFRSLAHRGIESDNYYDCSFIFLYILTNMSLRSSVQKLLGFSTSRAVDQLATQQFNKQFDQYNPDAKKSS